MSRWTITASTSASESAKPENTRMSAARSKSTIDTVTVDAARQRRPTTRRTRAPSSTAPIRGLNA